MASALMFGIAIGAVIVGAMVLIVGLFFPDQLKSPPQRAIVVGLIAIIIGILIFLSMYRP